MIFDFSNAYRLWYYKNCRGPFCVIFYEENNPKNKELYIYLKEILKNYNYIPFLRFKYRDFKANFPSEKITSVNQILIIEEQKESRIKDTDDYKKIPEIITNVSDNLIEKRTLKNVQFRQRKKFRPWAPNGHNFKASELLKLDQYDTNFLYKFPNITSNFTTIGYFNKRITDTELPQSNIQPKTIFKHKKRLSLKFTQNQTTSPLSSPFLPIQKIDTSHISKIKVLEKSENPLDLRILKKSSNIHPKQIKIDELLDLSIPKAPTESSVRIAHLGNKFNILNKKYKNSIFESQKEPVNGINNLPFHSKKFILDINLRRKIFLVKKKQNPIYLP